MYDVVNECIHLIKRKITCEKVEFALEREVFDSAHSIIQTQTAWISGVSWKGI